MTETIELQLPSGAIVLIDAPGDKNAGMRPLSPGAGKTTIRHKLEEIITPLPELLSTLGEQFNNFPAFQVDKVTMEVSVEIGTNGVIKLLGADAKGGLKVSIAWTPVKKS